MAMKDIREMRGVYVGHSTNKKGGTGCTVIVCPEGATGAVDVRGGAPATRETDLLRPEETVGELHAVVLAGGSAFGLSASCGVADELERRGIGLDVGVTRVPIVSGACLFDLAYGDPCARPTEKDGSAAVADAFQSAQEPLPRGNVGAGTVAPWESSVGPRTPPRPALGWTSRKPAGLCARQSPRSTPAGTSSTPRQGRS